MKSDNRYEAAFAAYLRDRGVGFVGVDEAKRTVLADGDVKSLDFIVVDVARLVIDVKGRKFPGGKPEKPRRVWETWSTQEDVDGLARWAKTFGPGFRGVLAFVYRIQAPYELPEGTADVFEHRETKYLMRGVDLETYREAMVRRSPKWGTVHLPKEAFRRAVRPFGAFLAAAPEPQPSLFA